ncbi:MAG: flagellar biosynthetic protein FliO, partial [Desulfobacterales bacterium]|nr:flagellar biosynthetic protein FliO [Desulfobacterales bacterium]
VLGGLLLTLWFFKRFVQTRAGGVNNRLIRVLASTAIGLKKNITLVDVPGAILILGVTGDRISLLARIEDPETMRKIRGEIPSKPVIPFGEQLQFFSARLKGRQHGR